MGRGVCVQKRQKRPLTSLFPLNSTKVGIGVQNFLTFSFNPFATMVYNFKAIPTASLKVGFSGQIVIKIR